MRMLLEILAIGGVGAIIGSLGTLGARAIYLKIMERTFEAGRQSGIIEEKKRNNGGYRT